MQSQNRLLDDLARVATGALGVASGMRQEVEGRLRAQFERILAEMDLVPREEFEVTKAMATKARQRQEELEERVAALEKQLASGGAKTAAAKKPAARKTASSKTAAKKSPAKKTAAKKTGAKTRKSS